MKASNIFNEYRINDAGSEIASKKSSASSIVNEASNRFVFSLSFIICVMFTVVIYAAVHFLMLLIFGEAIVNSEDSLYDAISYFEILFSVVMSLPFYHGYSILISGACTVRRADISHIIIPFSSFGLFMSSFLVSLLSFLSAAVPVTCVVLFSLSYETRLLLLISILMTPLWIYFTSVFRRMCRVHAYDYSMSLKDCLLCAHSASRNLKKEMRICAFSFTGNLLLSLITVLVYGIWGGFARKNLTAAMYAGDMIDDYKYKKD